MSEESIVTLIGMILSAGVLAPGIGWLNRRLGDGEAKPAPVTTADADAVHAHQSQQLVLASLNAMGAALASTQGDLEDTRGVISRRSRSAPPASSAPWNPCGDPRGRTAR